MTDGIVDHLETIEVEKQNAKLGTTARGMSNRLFETVTEERPIGQTRQRIMERRVLDRLLFLLAV